jgi:hypothetical protein
MKAWDQSDSLNIYRILREDISNLLVYLEDGQLP